MAIGGWNEGSAKYSNLTANPVRRKQFIKQTLEFIQKYNFDGLDLDWEYPTQRDGSPEDRENFVDFVRELRDAFKPYKLLLTSAFGASKKVIDAAYDVRALNKYLDYIHVMAYDYGGSWDNKVGWNAPLWDITELNIHVSIEHLIKLGASPAKIVLGIPFYGRTFMSTTENGWYADPTEGGGFAGPYTREMGFMGFNEICEAKDNKTLGWHYDWHDESKQSILRWNLDNGTTKVVTYDSTRSVANKMRFIVRKGLAGAMIWSVDTDDFLGECSPDVDTFADFTDLPQIRLVIPKRVNNNYPMLRTINEALIVSLDERVQENEIDKTNEISHDDTDEKGSAVILRVENMMIGIIVVLMSLRWI